MLPIEDDAAERRTYYRIHDEVALHYRVVPQDQAESVIERLQAGAPDKLTLTAGFATTTLQMRRVMDKVRREMPDVASYLEGLNDKLDMLVRLLVASESDLPDQPTHDVNLSASGLSFRTATSMPPGTLLELKLLVFPSFVCFLTLGSVARCIRLHDGPPEAPFEVAVEFTYIREDDRELLIRHVLQKQSSMLRDARALAEQQPQSRD